MVATTMMGKIERDNDVSPDEIGNCGATRSWQQWPDYKLAAISKVATRRWCGDGESVRARYPTVADRKPLILSRLAYWANG